MNVNFSRRGAIRAVSLLCAVFLALSALTVVHVRRAHALERQAQTASQHALRDNIATALQKARFVSSGAMLSRVERELSRSAACAKVSLSALTNADTDGTNVYKFLSQVGDFTYALQKTLERGGKLTAKQRASLQELLAYAQSFSDGLHALDAETDDGGFEIVK